jgi:hypothetical protein
VRRFPARIGLAVLVAAAFTAAPATAQSSAQAMAKEEITALAKLHIAISHAHDSIQAQLAQSRNKTALAQQQLQEKLRAEVEQILHHNGVTEAEYRRKTYLVSTDPEVRKTFDGIVAQLTGVPTPGQAPAVARGPTVAVPAGPVGAHIGHVVNSFNDTPNSQSLLATAMAEARTANQHATLGVRNPANLDGMKTHAGHVIHAIDPTVVTAGPGAGYGVKKAATGVAMHIDLAAKTPGASPNVVTHANHIGTAAKSTVTRADQVVALAKQVQAATTAEAAAALMNQIVSLTQQLISGADANSDGRIGWQEGEGGLQQADEHLKLLLAAEVKPAG